MITDFLKKKKQNEVMRVAQQIANELKNGTYISEIAYEEDNVKFVCKVGEDFNEHIEAFNNAINGRYYQYEDIRDFLKDVPAIKDYFKQFDTDIEESGMLIDVKQMGKLKLIRSNGEYFQMPWKTDFPVFVLGWRVFYEWAQEEVVRFR